MICFSSQECLHFERDEKSMFILRHFQYGISNDGKVSLGGSNFLALSSQMSMRNGVLELFCTNFREPINGNERCSHISYILVHGSKNKIPPSPQKKTPKQKQDTHVKYILGKVDSEKSSVDSEPLTEKVKFELKEARE